MSARSVVFAWVLVALIVGIGSLYGWKQYRSHEDQEEFKRRYQAALEGNPVLTVPDNFPVGPKEALLAIKPCGPGMFIGRVSCHGEGELFGIPGYLDVDHVDATNLHSLTYSFQLPAKPRLIHNLEQLYGPPHYVYARYPARGLCWPLPAGEEILMEYDEHSDADPGVTISVNSQVAAKLIRLVEAIPTSCDAQPIAPVRLERSPPAR
jgi:hypothetical protein